MGYEFCTPTPSSHLRLEPSKIPRMARNWISPLELNSRLENPHLVLFDTQFNLMNPALGRELYAEGHLPGAYFLDINLDLSSPVLEHGGRHPLPDLTELVDKLERSGVTHASEIVVYDDMGGMYAARLWWLLKYLGHDDVKLLDGGLNAWLEAGFQMTVDVPPTRAGKFTPTVRPELLATLEDVQKAVQGRQVRLLDARAAERFRGEKETVDPVAGHIPGAENYPFMDNLENGHFKALELLEQRFEGVNSSAILYCGSGVTAAHNALVLDELGVKPKLYAGSWSDWISYPENPIKTGDRP